MDLRRCVAVLVLVALPWAVAAWPVRTDDYLFWPEMPSAESVRGSIQGTNPLDTAARRHAAFSILLTLVAIHRDGRGDAPRPEREKILNASYTEELADIIREVRETRRIEVEQRSLSLQADADSTSAFLGPRFSRAALDEIEPFIARMREDASQRVERKRSGIEAVKRASTASPFRAAVLGAGGPLLFFSLALLLPVLLLLAIAREFLPHGLDPVNSTVGRRAFRRYIIDRDTGVVATAAGRLALNTVDGKVRDLDDQRETANLQVGQRLSVLWAILPDKTTSPFLLFRDHVTRHSVCEVPVVRRLFAPSWWPVVLLGPVAAVCGALASDFADIGTAGRIALPVVLLIVGCVAGYFLRERVALRRVRRFEADVRERIAPELDRRSILISG